MRTLTFPYVTVGLVGGVLIAADYPEAENNLGLALAKLGRIREALPHFEAALRLRPDYPEARQNHGVAQRALR